VTQAVISRIRSVNGALGAGMNNERQVEYLFTEPQRAMRHTYRSFTVTLFTRRLAT